MVLSHVVICPRASSYPTHKLNNFASLEDEHSAHTHGWLPGTLTDNNCDGNWTTMSLLIASSSSSCCTCHTSDDGNYCHGDYRPTMSMSSFHVNLDVAIDALDCIDLQCSQCSRSPTAQPCRCTPSTKRLSSITEDERRIGGSVSCCECRCRRCVSSPSASPSGRWCT